jgi:hypothetical protein
MSRKVRLEGNRLTGIKRFLQQACERIMQKQIRVRIEKLLRIGIQAA